MSFFSPLLPSPLCQIIKQRDIDAFEEYLLSPIMGVNYSNLLEELCANDIAYDLAHVKFIKQILSMNLETTKLTNTDKQTGIYKTFEILASSPPNRLSWTGEETNNLLMVVQFFFESGVQFIPTYDKPQTLGKKVHKIFFGHLKDSTIFYYRTLPAVLLRLFAIFETTMTRATFVDMFGFVL